MPPKEEKILCACCNTNLAPKVERAHRRALVGAPYPPQNPTYPSRQRQIFRRSSEVDPDDYGDNAVAGPSSYQDLDPASEADSKDSLQF